MEQEVGKIIHYYDKIGVGVVRLSADLEVGDTIHVKGKASDFEQTVESMQLEHEGVSSAKAGIEVALKLVGKAKEGDVLYKRH